MAGSLIKYVREEKDLLLPQRLEPPRSCFSLCSTCARPYQLLYGKVYDCCRQAATWRTTASYNVPGVDSPSDQLIFLTLSSIYCILFVTLSTRRSLLRRLAPMSQPPLTQNSRVRETPPNDGSPQISRYSRPN